jgi:hypothetical protein
MLSAGAADAAPKARRSGGSSASSATDAQAAKSMEVAQKIYLQGAAHYRSGRLLEALAAFRASYDIVPSPNSHIMIARTLRDKGDIAQAYAEYDRVVGEADEASKRDAKYQATADTARSERTKLREKLTMVIVRAKSPPDDLRVSVGGRPIERSEWGKPVPVPAGALVALGVADGRSDQRKELSGFPGDELVVLFDYSTPPPRPTVSREPTQPSPPPPDDSVVATPFVSNDATPDIPHEPPRPAPPPTNRTWAYVSLGASGAGLLTFFTFGALDQSTYNDLQKTCPNMHCTRADQDQVDKGRSYQTIANIGLGVAVVAGSLGAILLTGRGDDAAPATYMKRPQKGPVLTDVAVGPASLQVRGAF